MPALAVASLAAQDATARLGAGIAAFQRQDYPAAMSQLKGLERQLPAVADYVAYYRAAAEVAGQTEADVRDELAPVWSSAVLSPLRSKAALAAAAGLTASGKAPDAVRLLADHYEELAQPDGDMALAAAYQGAGDLPHAAIFYQQVYDRYPALAAAEKASGEIASLRASLGTAFPSLSPQMMLLRGDRLLEARDYAGARSAYQALIPLLSGVEQQQARVRLGAADCLGGDAGAAEQYLRGLEVTDPEAEAERLYYLEECARHRDDDAALMEAVRRLNDRHPHSPWRFKALLGAGNRYLVANRPSDYEPLYEAAAQAFPQEPRAAAAHWKYVWAGYMRRQGDAGDRLREHLRLFPGNSTAASALYFLGRLAEDGNDPASARAYYGRAAELFPNYYYGLIARRKLAQPAIEAAAPAPQALEFLATVAWPGSRYTGAKAPARETGLRLERARILRAAGLGDLADGELRFGARHGAQPVPLAIEMARSANSAFLALRAMKSLVPDSLTMPFDGAPKDFWELLFPLPYRSDLLNNARRQGLDPSLLAALIRQESEFNPRALSRAKAYGLTQVLPSTGRSLARKAGLRSFNSRMLFQPATSLRLGTLYLRMLLDQFNGNWEQTLAAYNAGKSRVTQWEGWGSYRDPAEFVESIPFTETREYVQAILRNAELYRRIYGDKLK